MQTPSIKLILHLKLSASGPYILCFCYALPGDISSLHIYLQIIYNQNWVSADSISCFLSQLSRNSNRIICHQGILTKNINRLMNTLGCSWFCLSLFDWFYNWQDIINRVYILSICMGFFVLLRLYYSPNPSPHHLLILLLFYKIKSIVLSELSKFLDWFKCPWLNRLWAMNLHILYHNPPKHLGISSL